MNLSTKCGQTRRPCRKLTKLRNDTHDVVNNSSTSGKIPAPVPGAALGDLGLPLVIKDVQFADCSTFERSDNYSYMANCHYTTADGHRSLPASPRQDSSSFDNLVDASGYLRFSAEDATADVAATFEPSTCHSKDRAIGLFVSQSETSVQASSYQSAAPGTLGNATHCTALLDEYSPTICYSPDPSTAPSSPTVSLPFQASDLFSEQQPSGTFNDSVLPWTPSASGYKDLRHCKFRSPHVVNQSPPLGRGKNLRETSCDDFLWSRRTIPRVLTDCQTPILRSEMYTQPVLRHPEPIQGFIVAHALIASSALSTEDLLETSPENVPSKSTDHASGLYPSEFSRSHRKSKSWDMQGRPTGTLDLDLAEPASTVPVACLVDADYNGDRKPIARNPMSRESGSIGSKSAPEPCFIAGQDSQNPIACLREPRHDLTFSAVDETVVGKTKTNHRANSSATRSSKSLLQMATGSKPTSRVANADHGDSATSLPALPSDAHAKIAYFTQFLPESNY